jgi:hypothetical protein
MNQTATRHAPVRAMLAAGLLVLSGVALLGRAGGLRPAAPAFDAPALALALALPAAALAPAWRLPRTASGPALVRGLGGVAAGASAGAALQVLAATWLRGPAEPLGAVPLSPGRVAAYAVPGPATAPWTSWVQVEEPVLPGVVRVRRLRTWRGAADLRLAPAGPGAVRVAAQSAGGRASPEVVAVQPRTRP